MRGARYPACLFIFSKSMQLYLPSNVRLLCMATSIFRPFVYAMLDSVTCFVEQHNNSQHEIECVDYFTCVERVALRCIVLYPYMHVARGGIYGIYNIPYTALVCAVYLPSNPVFSVYFTLYALCDVSTIHSACYIRVYIVCCGFCILYISYVWAVYIVYAVCSYVD